MRELHILHVTVRIASNHGRMPPNRQWPGPCPIFGLAQGPPFPSVAVTLRSCVELLPGAHKAQSGAGPRLRTDRTHGTALAFRSIHSRFQCKLLRLLEYFVGRLNAQSLLKI